MMIPGKVKSVFVIFLTLIFLVFIEQSFIPGNNYIHVIPENLKLHKIAPPENSHNFISLHNEQLQIQVKPGPIDKIKISHLFSIGLFAILGNFHDHFISVYFPSRLKLDCILRI